MKQPTVGRQDGMGLWLAPNSDFDYEDLFVSTKWQLKPQVLL